MITVTELSKRYGPILALDQLSLKVPAGAVFGLLGPNGAGKTTLLRLIMGFAFPDAGQIDRRGLPPASIGYLPERAFYPVRFTVREYLCLISRLAGVQGAAAGHQVDQLLLQFGLVEAAGRRLGACSRGMLQRLGLAQALLGAPSLLLLDEPARGLDPAGQVFMRDQILRLHGAGKTVVLSSHHLDEVTRTCTHIGVLNKGRIVLAGELTNLLASRQGGPSDAHQISITTSPIPADLVPSLTSLSPGVAVAERGILLSGEGVAHKAQALRLLLDAQVDIQQLRQTVTLEDVYLEAIRR